MTYIVKRRRGSTSMVCVYTCSLHGAFDVEVQRDENGDAPDMIVCGVDLNDPLWREGHRRWCDRPATWTPSALVACRVRRFEVARGKWEKPERPTYLDTRELGEGQSMDEFRAKRREVWERKRQEDVMNVKKGFL